MFLFVFLFCLWFDLVCVCCWWSVLLVILPGIFCALVFLLCWCFCRLVPLLCLVSLLCWCFCYAGDFLLVIWSGVFADGDLLRWWFFVVVVCFLLVICCAAVFELVFVRCWICGAGVCAMFFFGAGYCLVPVFLCDGVSVVLVILPSVISVVLVILFWWFDLVFLLPVICHTGDFIVVLVILLRCAGEFYVLADFVLCFLLLPSPSMDAVRRLYHVGPGPIGFLGGRCRRASLAAMYFRQAASREEFFSRSRFCERAVSTNVWNSLIQSSLRSPLGSSHWTVHKLDLNCVDMIFQKLVRMVLAN